jgi:outer membrane receptor for ferrienterochelin and colicins
MTTKIPQLFAPKISGTYAISYPIAKAGVAFDVTGRFTGPMYLPVVPNDFRAVQSPMYNIVNLQITKTFKKGLEIYSGVKNIFNFLPANPLLHPDDPFDKAGGKYFDANGVARASTNPYGYVFDPSYNYATMQGAKAYIGVRWQIK